LTRHNLRSCTLLLVIVLLVAVPVLPEADAQPLHLRVAPEINRGEVLRVVVDGAGILAVTARLAPPDARPVEAPGVRVAEVSGEAARWQVLLGVDHGSAGGETLLEVEITTDEGLQILSRAITVVPRAFPFEEIALNTAMSALRRTEDPRRDEESRELWALLTRTDAAAVHHAGRFIYPLESYRRTSAFGHRRLFRYTDGGSARSVHNGIDMAAPTGTPVRAPARGRVVMAMDRLITGGTIVLEHQPGMYTIYYHLESVAVEVGGLVNQGMTIGTVGSTGVSTGPHLHWEVRVAGAAVDPEWFVSEPMVDMDAVPGALSTLP
jgi:murein DD-endopeptidase MepM/ murein hydrolase activator NlpD